MHNLLCIQASFQDYLLTGDLSIMSAIVSDIRDAKQRLEVYFNAYRIRLIDVLKADYPKLRLYMGDEEFEKLSLAYLKAFPSEHFSVRYLGQHLLGSLDSVVDSGAPSRTWSRMRVNTIRTRALGAVSKA